MSQVSKRMLKPEIEREILNSLSYIFSDLRSKSEIDEFLSSALTKTERLMISKRVLASFLLMNGVEANKVCDTLKITNASATRIKMWVGLHKEGFDIVFKRLKKKRMENEAKQILVKFLNYAIKASTGTTPNPFKIHA